MFSKNRNTQSGRGSPPRRVNPDERIYAVGDIHGRYDLFLTALKLIQSDADAFDDGRKVKLIVLGDFIDRGDDASLVVDALLALGEDNPDVVTMLGNHEAAMLDFISDPVSKPGWLQFGASQTLASYGVVADLRNPRRGDLIDIRDALRSSLINHLDFLEGLGHYTRSGNVVFTHAGVDPAGDPNKPSRQAALWGHPDFRTAQPISGMCVVHGHYDNDEPVVLPGRICIDTGAYYSGRLTVLRLDNDAKILTVTNQ
jgi:serine/threonine protein phosphatase 1